MWLALWAVLLPLAALGQSRLGSDRTTSTLTGSSGPTDVNVVNPTLAVVGGDWLTDGQLRAAALAVTLASVPTHAVTLEGTPPVVANQGTPAALSGAWPVKLVDAAGANAASVSAGGALYVNLNNALPAGGNTIGAVSVNGTVPVSGTFWQATQPVSLASVPVHGVTDNGGSLTVDGSVSVSNFPATQAVSAASLPLPAGAATEASLAGVKTGTDRIPASLTVKGASVAPVAADPALVVTLSPNSPAPGTQTVSGTVGVSNFPATQAVTGTFWQATQPVSLASVPTHAVTQSGTWAANVATAAKGTTTAGSPTSTAVDANTQALDVAIKSQAIALSVQNVSSGGNLNTRSFLADDTTLTYARVLAAAPTSTDAGLVVRNIPSGTQPVSGSVTVSGTVTVTQTTSSNLNTKAELEDGSGNPVASAVAAPAGSERGLIVRNIPSGTQAVSASPVTFNAGVYVKKSGGATTTAVACGTTATAMPAASIASRQSMCVKNPSSNTADVYIGGSSVTVANGFPLHPGDAWCDDINQYTYYCIVDAGTVTVRTLEN